VDQRAREHYKLCLGRNTVSLAESRRELDDVFSSLHFQIREDTGLHWTVKCTVEEL
jgi:hypothetical protein